jgi:prefoldin subunit 5
MARRKANGGDHISLFPFMSILVALIGALTLMITSLLAGQMNREQPQEVVDRYGEYTKLKADLAEGQKELEELRKQIAAVEKMLAELRQAQQEVAALEKKQKDHLVRLGPDSEYAKLLSEANRLRQRTSELEREPAKLQATVEQLQREVEQRKAGPKGATVQIRPGGSGVNLVGTFVECTSTGVVVHEDPQPKRLRAGDLGQTDGDFRKLLDRVAGTPRGQVIFLVRPDGVDTYNAAQGVARSHYGPKGYCKTGKLPVPSQGIIDLSQIR